jgi:hypothetical protein
MGALVSNGDKWVGGPCAPGNMQVLHEEFANFLVDLYLGAYLYEPRLCGVDAECRGRVR